MLSRTNVADESQSTIVAFHQDEEQYWIAELSCGRRQHVRHRPPFVERQGAIELTEYKHLSLGRLTVRVNRGKAPVEHCADCGKAVEGRTGKIDRFERLINVEGSINAAVRERLVEIANKCPVHRTLEAGAAVVTKNVGITETSGRWS